jgi:hypothetical protein
MREAGEEFLARLLGVRRLASRGDLFGDVAHHTQHGHASPILLEEADARLDDALAAVATADHRLKGGWWSGPANIWAYSASADARSDAGKITAKLWPSTSAGV